MLKIVKKHPFISIFILMLVAHIYFFYDGILSLPSIQDGSMFISRDELVPIFDIKSQFVNQILGSEETLTYSDEVRLSYSFWTAWVRYSPILPIAMIVMNALSAFIFFVSSHLLLKNFLAVHGIYRERNIFIASFLGTFPLYLILLYAKVTTFYSLIFGFALFSLALSLFIKSVLINKTYRINEALIIGLLILLNPAIHFHVLIYLPIVLISASLIIYRFYKSQPRVADSLIVFTFIILASSLIPYVLLIIISTSIAQGNLSTQIPLSYWGIYYNSLSIEYLLGFNTTAQADVGRYGNYIIPIPRISSILFFLYIISGVMLVMSYKILKKTRYLVLLFVVLLLLAMYMSAGYSEGLPYSFHFVFRDIVNGLSKLGDLGNIFEKAAYTFLNILRFPHRFQFIQFYAAGFLLSVFILQVLSSKKLKPAQGLILCSLIAFAPIILDQDYRNAFITQPGSMGSYLEPYPVSEDLKDIKNYLNEYVEPKVFILPSLESGRTINTESSNFSFIDKALIYYLNTPTYYYGAGANVQNKVLAEKIYTELDGDLSIWEDILAKNLKITHLLVPNNLVQNKKQVIYYPYLEDKLLENLSSSENYKLKISGDNFDLYEINSGINDVHENLIDFADSYVSSNLVANDNLSDFIYPIQYSEFLDQSKRYNLHTDQLNDALINIYSAVFKERVYYPDVTDLVYQDNPVESSVFATTGLSLSVLNDPKNNYNLFDEKIPSMINLLQPKFVGTTKGAANIKININTSMKGEYNIYLYAYTNDENIIARAGTQNLIFKQLNTQGNLKSNYRYYVASAKLEDKNELLINSSHTSPIIVGHTYIESTDSENNVQVQEISRNLYSISFTE